MEKYKSEDEKYRDKLAGKLREMRNVDGTNPAEDHSVAHAKAEGYLEGIQETEQYKRSEYFVKYAKPLEEAIRDEKIGVPGVGNVFTFSMYDSQDRTNSKKMRGFYHILWSEGLDCEYIPAEGSNKDDANNPINRTHGWIREKIPAIMIDASSIQAEKS